MSPTCEVELDTFYTFDSLTYQADSHNTNAGFILYFSLNNNPNNYAMSIAFNEFRTSRKYNFTASLNG